MGWSAAVDIFCVETLGTFIFGDSSTTNSILQEEIHVSSFSPSWITDEVEISMSAVSNWVVSVYENWEGKLSL